MTHWTDNAKCKGDPNPRRWFHDPKEHLLDLQDICALCPARKACGTAAMAEEADGGDDMRAGFRAYMTPKQRSVIHRLGGLQGRDPMEVVLGITKTRRRTPAIPEEGIEWNRAHTALARKLTKHLQATCTVGWDIPGDDVLCKYLGCSPKRLHVVLDSLVQSGILAEHEPLCYVLSPQVNQKESV